MNGILGQCFPANCGYDWVMVRAGEPNLPRLFFRQEIPPFSLQFVEKMISHAKIKQEDKWKGVIRCGSVFFQPARSVSWSRRQAGGKSGLACYWICSWLHWLNPDYLSNFYKEKMGLPLAQYINSRRLFKAASWLAFEKTQIKEIAWRMCYNEQRSFARFFRKKTGFSPECYWRKFKPPDPEDPASD